LHDLVVGDAIRARRSVVRYAPNSSPASCLRDLAGFLAKPNRLRDGEQGINRDSFEHLAAVGSEPETEGGAS